MEYLIAEIAGRKRWTQINIPADLVSFFGNAVNVGNVDVVPVRLNGQAFATEHRIFGSKTSINWTFGLSAKLASDSDHPGSKQPISVFRRISNAPYRYCLVMPSSPAYAALEAHLAATYTGPARNRKRVLVSKKTLGQIFPSSPL